MLLSILQFCVFYCVLVFFLLLCCLTWCNKECLTSSKFSHTTVLVSVIPSVFCSLLVSPCRHHEPQAQCWLKSDPSLVCLVLFFLFPRDMRAEKSTCLLLEQTFLQISCASWHPPNTESTKGAYFFPKLSESGHQLSERQLNCKSSSGFCFTNLCPVKVSWLRLNHGPSVLRALSLAEVGLVTYPWLVAMVICLQTVSADKRVQPANLAAAEKKLW